jgi:N-acetylmuramate 1-kinase
MFPVTDTVVDARRELLESWLTSTLGIRLLGLEAASADASFRRYFRANTAESTLIVMDAPPDREDLGPFMAVAGALERLGLNVPKIVASDRRQGFLLLTDLGSTHYLAALNAAADPDALYSDAIDALLKLQVRESEAGIDLPPYSRELLDREVRLFPEWFLGRHLELDTDAGVTQLVDRVSMLLADAALEQEQVIVHRDFHSRNLMVTAVGNPGVLDFQDAVRGAITYDLVSLLKDCYVVWPRSRVLDWLRAYRDRAMAAGLGVGASEEEFVRWFDLMGVQRHLKVLGIFARLWYRDGKIGYLRDLPVVLQYVLDAAAMYPELDELNRFLLDRVVPRFPNAQSRVLG